jgi:hypothetical protein
LPGWRLSNFTGELDRALENVRLVQKAARTDCKADCKARITRPDRAGRGLAGETEKMMEIQQLCWLAGISAETVARAKAEGRLEEEWAQHDLERYRRLRAECIEVADKITDEWYRAPVINYLAEVCMKAADVDDARALFKHQGIKSFRQDIAAQYPELVRPCMSEIVGGRTGPNLCL